MTILKDKGLKVFVSGTKMTYKMKGGD